MISLFKYIAYGLALIVLIYITKTDIQIKKISNRSLVLLAAVGIATVYDISMSVSERVWGLILSGGLPLLIAVCLPGTFGGGDIKLLAIAGILLGWRGGLLALCAAFLSGGIYSTILLLGGKMKRKDTIAFGPFICLGLVLGFVYSL